MVLSETVCPFALAAITSKEPRGEKPGSGLRCDVVLLVGYILHPVMWDPSSVSCMAK